MKELVTSFFGVCVVLSWWCLVSFVIALCFVSNIDGGVLW